MVKALGIVIDRRPKKNLRRKLINGCLSLLFYSLTYKLYNFIDEKISTIIK